MMNGTKTCCFWVVFFMLGFTCICQASLTDGLVAYYPFNGNANDESGNGNNGVNYGATPTTDRFGNANSAFNFDGVNAYIDVSNIASDLKGVGTGSISIWFMTGEKNKGAQIFAYGDGLKQKWSSSSIHVGPLTGTLSGECISPVIMPNIFSAYTSYSPNLQLIERLWKFLKKKCLYSKYYANFGAFKSAITDCLSHTHDLYKGELDSLLTLRFQTVNDVKKVKLMPL